MKIHKWALQNVILTQDRDKQLQIRGLTRRWWRRSLTTPQVHPRGALSSALSKLPRVFRRLRACSILASCGPQTTSLKITLPSGQQTLKAYRVACMESLHPDRSWMPSFAKRSNRLAHKSAVVSLFRCSSAESSTTTKSVIC